MKLEHGPAALLVLSLASALALTRFRNGGDHSWVGGGGWSGGGFGGFRR